jgi:RNA polymerase sigma-B factor
VRTENERTDAELQVKLLERSIDRCARVIDEAVADRTIPSKRRARCNLRGSFVAPSVEPEVWRDHIALHRHGDTDARDRLVVQYEGHARALARRFYRQREPLDDLQQVALEALLLALERFDPEHRKPFFGFANPTIIGSLRRHYRDTGWAMRVPRRVHDLSSSLRDAREILTQDLGRTPSMAELADMMDLDEHEVEEVHTAMGARSLDSIDSTLGERDPADLIGREDRNLSLAENWVAVQQILEQLPDGDRELLHLYFAEELTQTQIAERTGVSQMHVSRSLTRILRQMRSHLPSD